MTIAATGANTARHDVQNNAGRTLLQWLRGSAVADYDATVPARAELLARQASGPAAESRRKLAVKKWELARRWFWAARTTR